VCHDTDVVIESCEIRDWAGQGINIVGSSDVTVQCNCIAENEIGVQHQRKTPGIDGQNGVTRLRRNNLVENEFTNFNSLDKPSGGPYGVVIGDINDASTGENRLELDPGFGDDWNYRLWDTTQGERTELAQLNVWLDDIDGTLTPATVQPTIERRFPSFHEVLVDTVFATSPTCSTPCEPSGGSAAQRDGSPASSIVHDPEAPGSSAAEELGLVRGPHEFTLGLSTPNPTSGPVGIVLDIPQQFTGQQVHVVIHDVGGRRVWSWTGQVEGAGHRLVHWGLVTRDGSRASPGVYFIRARVGEAVAIRKLSVLR
jgi:hypothetical protein